MEKYDDSEVEEILRRAAKRDDGLEHEDLVSAAKEAGIDPAAVERAAAAVREERATRVAVAVVDERDAKRRRRFIRSLSTFAVVNTFLFLIDLLTGGGWWFYWPLLSWGLMVALQGVSLLTPLEDLPPPKKSRKERRREEAEARRAEQRAKRTDSKTRLKEAERTFDAAIEHGVASVLEKVAHGIGRVAGSPSSKSSSKSSTKTKRDSEFGRYVAARQSHEPAKPSARSAPAVRVDLEREDEEVQEESPATAERAREA